jgi:hypothetical protein
MLRWLDALVAEAPVTAVELRPPAAQLDAAASMEAWIDNHHGVGRLLQDGRFVLFTDDAVGLAEEESLSHLTANLGPEARLEQILPFLTCKHPLAYCEWFGRRATAFGFGGITVTGGDQIVGPPRCLPRSRDLRGHLRADGIALPLGMWVNLERDPVEQVGFLVDQEETADYYLTQVVSHHAMGPVDRFINELERRGVRLPGLVGVFHYRSANPATLARLQAFLPVPARELTREFVDEGLTAHEVTARTLKALHGRGIRHTYLSNLHPRRAARDATAIEEIAGVSGDAQAPSAARSTAATDANATSTAGQSSATDNL